MAIIIFPDFQKSQTNFFLHFLFFFVYNMLWFSVCSAALQWESVVQQSQLSSDKWWGPSLLYCLTVSEIQIIHVRLKNYHFMWQDVADIYRVGLPTIIMQQSEALWHCSKPYSSWCFRNSSCLFWYLLQTVKISWWCRSMDWDRLPYLL